MKVNKRAWWFPCFLFYWSYAIILATVTIYFKILKEEVNIDVWWFSCFLFNLDVMLSTLCLLCCLVAGTGNYFCWIFFLFQMLFKPIFMGIEYSGRFRPTWPLSVGCICWAAAYFREIEGGWLLDETIHYKLSILVWWS